MYVNILALLILLRNDLWCYQASDKKIYNVLFLWVNPFGVSDRYGAFKLMVLQAT